MTADSTARDGYFERVDEHSFAPTRHSGGGWDPQEVHFSPLGGLVVHAIDRHMADRPGMLLGRVSFDILGRLDAGVCEIRVQTVRPGRTIELVEATVVVASRPVVRARAWFLSFVDTAAVAGGGGDRLPSPDTLAPRSLGWNWPGGFVASLDVRPVVAPIPGRTTAWLATGVDLVAGEATSPLASFIALVDTANGIAARRTPDTWVFPNVDLTVHLHRQPTGGWVGLDTTVVFGATGQGVTSTVVHDLDGPVGHAQQTLTVRPVV